MFAAREQDPETFDRSEQQLVDAAEIHSMNDLRRIAAYWRQHAEREAAAEGDKRSGPADDSTRRCRSSAWSGSTETSIRRRARRC